MKKIRKPLMLLLALVLLLGGIASPARAATERTGVIHGGWLILRAGPSRDSAILSSYPSGTVVTITGTVGSWYAVRTPDSLTGYMLSTYITVQSGSSSGGIVPADGTTAYVTSANGRNVRLRTGPGTGYAILAAYAPGTACTVLYAGTTWSQIRIGSRTGYMMTQFLSTNQPATPAPADPQIVPSEGYQVYVTSRNGQGVNLRSGPGKQYASIGFYGVGTAAWMVSNGPVWSYIRVGSRYGYMMTQFLTTTQLYQDASSGSAVVTGAYVVSANGRNVNLRATPSTAGQKIGSYRVGTPLTVITRGTDWYFIQISGRYGYMMRQFIYEGLSPATLTDLKP